jgi:ribosomal protein S18 acetylase RimI-like enzyme
MVMNQTAVGAYGPHTQEEIECFWAMGLWMAGIDNFIIVRNGDKILGFARYVSRDLATGVFDLYWIAVDAKSHRNGIGRKLLIAAKEALY